MLLIVVSYMKSYTSLCYLYKCHLVNIACNYISYILEILLIKISIMKMLPRQINVTYHNETYDIVSICYL